jgi:dephospho-CoA kinase
MLIVGLTGSIGMGKSTAAERFLHHGIAVFDADAAVHDLYRGEAAPLIEAAFPGTTSKGLVDRPKLTAALLADPEGFAKLEAIVHPLVRDVERRFLRTEAGRGAEMAVLEIPLLFETGADKLVDVVVVVSTDAETQAQRVLERPGMTREKLAQLLSRQVPDAEKRARADFVVETGGTISQSQAKIDSIIESLRGRTGGAYQRHWA